MYDYLLLLDLVNNSYIKMNSYKHKYKGKSSEKLLNILFNIPRERRIFFFEEFKNNDHIKNNEFIKMLEVILDMDEELFLDIFEDINKESYIHKSYNIYSSQVCRNIYFDYYSSINSFYEILKSDIECKVFFRVLESVLKFKVKELLEVFDSLGEDIRENFLLLSYYITFENIENYLNIFSYTEESKEEEIEIVVLDEESPKEPEKKETVSDDTLDLDDLFKTMSIHVLKDDPNFDFGLRRKKD